MKQTKIPNKLDKFEKSLVNRGVKSTVIPNYVRAATVFLSFLADREFDDDVAEEYKEYLRTNYSNSAERAKLRGANMYLEFLGIRYKFKQDGTETASRSKFKKEKKIPNKLDKFEEQLIEQGKNHQIAKKYVRDAGVFLDYLGDREFNDDIAEEYREFILSKYTKSSAQSMLSCLNTYLEFLGIKYKFEQKDLNVHKKIPAESVLTKEEYNRLLDAAKEQGDERMFYIIETLCATGIQISDLEKVTVDALKFGYIEIEGKCKEKIKYLPTKLCRYLMDYSHSIGAESGSIFATQTDGSFNRTTVNVRLKRLCMVTNIDEQKLFPKNLQRLYKQTRAELEREIVENMGLV